MQRTSIEWTGSLNPNDGTMVLGFTANPLKYRAAAGNVVWGCVKTSPGCTHCYSETLAHRYGRGGPFKQSVMEGLTPFLDEKELRSMLTYKPASGKRCFVGDMTDVCGEWVPDELLDRLFAVFALRDDVTWQVLTKRASRLRDYFAGWKSLAAPPHAARVATACGRLGFSQGAAAEVWSRMIGPHLPNVWLGVSVEDQKRADERIPLLLETPAAVRFLSVEPLLGPISFADGPLHPEESTMGEWSVLDLGIHWVIVGGESGPSARPMQVEWMRSIVKQCKAASVPCFVKQLGTNPYQFDPKYGTRGIVGETPLSLIATGGDRKGGDIAWFPEDLRVREWPAPAAGGST